MASRLSGWLLALAFATSAAAQQAGPQGSVPTVHYGPPVCATDAKPPSKSDATARALAEQNQAVQDSRILPSADPLPNFGMERYKLVEYGECTGASGCYWADLDAQYRRAEAQLKKELAAKRPGPKLAIVMDIDETTLTNWCEMRREDFGYVPSLYRPWELSGSSAAIPGAMRLFNHARAAGVAVFFITGRPGRGSSPQQNSASDETAATAKNLEAAGFHGYAGLRLKNGDENQMPTIAYKALERQKITVDGYRIILNLGDQWSDLLGDPQADVSVKLPNPFYFIP